MKNSLNGYIATLQIRKNASLLVEGVTDQRALDIFIKEFAGNRPVTIDTVERLGTIEGISGNREKVEFIHQLALENGFDVAGLVDREFREFDLITLKDNRPGHHSISDSLFWTRGHSLENYFFDVRSVLAFLKIKFRAELPKDFSKPIRKQFRTILQVAASISVAAAKAEILTRAPGLFRPDSWQIDGNHNIVPNVAVITANFNGRKISAGARAIFLAELSAAFMASKRLTLAQLKWIAHGHVGYETLWSIVAFLLNNEFAVDPDIVRQIACGHNDLKTSSAVALWAEACRTGKDADVIPKPLLAWLGI
jgi:hypothetical protein